MKYLQGLLLIIFTGIVSADWHPPENPNPMVILDEARTDTRSGNYPDALAKHIWFHKNALKHQSSLYGVRLSFALEDWEKLSAEYMPALEEMKKVRDKAGINIKNQVEPYKNFHDYKSLNQVLHEEKKTIRLFSWLDKNNPKVALKIYRMAQPSLIMGKKYKLAGKYINPQSTYKRIADEYNSNKKYIAEYGNTWNSKRYTETKYFGEKVFSNSVSTLVALLTLNGKANDAKGVSDRALLEFDNPELRKELKKALEGVIPKAWP